MCCIRRHLGGYTAYGLYNILCLVLYVIPTVRQQNIGFPLLMRLKTDLLFPLGVLLSQLKEWNSGELDHEHLVEGR